MTTQKIVWSLLISGAVMTAACGDSKSSMNPVAPSAVVVDGSQSDEASGGVSGPQAKGGIKGPPQDKGKNGNGNGNGNGNQPSVPPSTQLPGNQTPTNTTPSAPRKVEIEGLISAKGGNTITVNAQMVTVPSTAVIRHGNKTMKFSDLKVGNRVHVKGMRTTTATGALAATSTIEASEVKLQNPGERDDDGDDDPDTANMLVSVAPLDATGAEAGQDPASFRLTRSGDLTAPLTVTFTLSGTAQNFTDYQAHALTVEFLAGQSTAVVTIIPVADGDSEGSETVILTVVDGAGYAAGSPAFATVTIVG